MTLLRRVTLFFNRWAKIFQKENAMLKSFHVTGLNGDLDHKLTFNKDLNIITGRNGSGKTSLLKLLWYLFSGNIERTHPEVQFRTAELKGDRIQSAC